MPLSLPSVTATAEHHTVTLAELRELVTAAAGLPGDTIVRGQTVLFHMPDLFNRTGHRLQTIALDAHREGE